LNETTITDRANGLDIADFIISKLKSKKNTLEIQSYFSPTLQSMIEKNKALLVLINGLELKET
jgi:ketopantoate reductase